MGNRWNSINFPKDFVLSCAHHYQALGLCDLRIWDTNIRIGLKSAFDFITIRL
jgi:hypothetical protein